MTEHIVTTLKTPLVERATHPPSQVREKEIVNICMYVHTKERHEREREKETERQRNTGRCGVKEPVSAAKTAYTGFSTGHRISSQPVCQTQIRKPKRAERSDSELQIFHLCRNLGDTTAAVGMRPWHLCPRWILGLLAPSSRSNGRRIATHNLAVREFPIAPFVDRIDHSPLTVGGRTPTLLVF